MKKLFMLLALALGVASCQNEPEGFDVVVGGEQDVNITVSLPDETRADSAEGFNLSTLSTSGYELRYILEIYLKDGDDSKKFREVKYSDATTVSFPVRLAPKREYHFAVWADLVVKDADRAEGADADYYYETSEGLKNITIDVNKWTPNVEARDAFYGNATLTKEQSIANLPTIELTRPFAKVRVVATDIEDVRKFGIEPTNAVAEYTTSEMYTEFDAVAGIAKGETTGKTHTFNYEDVDTYADATGQFTVFADYVFVPEDGNVQFTLNVNAENGLIKSNSFNTAIPVERNKVTSIVGDVLTEGGNVSITINGTLEEKETIKYVDNIVTLQDVINAAENGKQTTIKLGGNVVIDNVTTRAEQQYGLVIPAGKIIILDLNGKSISQTKKCVATYSMITNNGELTILDSSAAKSGKISFKDSGEGDSNFTWGVYTINNTGNLIVNGGTIENISAQNTPGNIVHMYCAIQQGNSTAVTTINDGVIRTPSYRSVRATNGEVVINGGVFEGQVWMQSDYHHTKLTINGGQFEPKGGDGSSIFITNTNADGTTVKINGGHFMTKIGCSNPTKDDVKGCITGGTFTTVAKENTNEALLANGYAFVEGENGTYTVENVGHYADAEGNYYITNATGLAWLAAEVNKYSNYERPFEGKTLYLTNDIDLGGIEWTPIGDYRFSANRFCGTFDGQNHTISNFKITKKTDKNDSNKSSYGFFGNLEGTVKNLTIANANVSSYAYTAALVGRFNNGLIENCHVVDCTVSNSYWQGGILIGQTNAEGEVAAIVRDCSVSNSSITSKSAIGAISGPVTAVKGGNVVFEDCSVEGCTIAQEGSFGGNYDKSFGSMFGYTEADADSSIDINNFTVSNTTVKGESDAPISGDFDGNITIDGCKIVTVDTEKGLVEAVKAQSIITLATDIAMTESIAISNANFTLDGNGYTITMAEDATNTYALFDITGGKATFKNVTFDGIKEGAVVRTVGVEFNAENVTAQNGQHTQQQGLFRLMGKSTIKDCTFKNNSCSMVITLNYDGDNNDPQVVENCVFEGNTCNGTAALYYVKGASATINGNKFIGNTVNCSSNGATIYMGFTENNVVTNNLFQNNTVNEASTSSRVAGGIFFGYETVFTGNAFVGNKVTGENAKGNDVCVSTYYTSIDLSGNYWGGNAPVEDTNYFVQHKSDERVVTINNYLTANPFN